MSNRQEIARLVSLAEDLKQVDMKVSNLVIGILLARWALQESDSRHKPDKIELRYLSEDYFGGPLKQHGHDLIAVGVHRSDHIRIPASLLSADFMAYLRMLDRRSELRCEKRARCQTSITVRAVDDLRGLERLSPEQYNEAVQSLWTLDPAALPELPEE